MGTVDGGRGGDHVPAICGTPRRSIAAGRGAAFCCASAAGILLELGLERRSPSMLPAAVAKQQRGTAACSVYFCHMLHLLLLLLAVGPQQDPAPPMSGHPVVDSAAVARTAYARATAALRANNLTAARREAARAARAWPTQPAYHWARVVIGLRARADAA